MKEFVKSEEVFAQTVPALTRIYSNLKAFLSSIIGNQKGTERYTHLNPSLVPVIIKNRNYLFIKNP